MTSKSIDLISNELFEFQKFNFDITRSNKEIFQKLIEDVENYGYESYIEKFMHAYGVNYSKVEHILNDMYEKCKTGNMCEIKFNNYLLAFRNAFDKLKDKQDKCDVIDFYIKHSVIIFLIYYYFYKTKIYANSQKISFYDEYVDHVEDDRQIELDRMIHTVYELTRCFTSVTIVRDIFFGDLREMTQSIASSTTNVKSINEYIMLSEESYKKNIYLEVTFISPVFDHIFSIIRSYDMVNKQFVFNVVQSYALNYCPKQKPITFEQFKEMINDLHSLFYSNHTIPYQEKYDLMEQSDAEIWEKYFYADINKYIDKFSKLYCWYEQNAVSNFYVSIVKFILQNLSEAVYNKFNITDQEWYSIFNSLKFIGMVQNPSVVVDVIFSGLENTTYQLFLMVICEKAWKIAKKLITDDELVKSVKISNGTIYTHYLDTVFKTVNNQMDSTVFENMFRNVDKENGSTTKIKINNKNMFTSDINKIYHFASIVINNLLTVVNSRLQTVPMMMNYKQINKKICYGNLLLLNNYTAHNILPIVRNLYKNNRQVKKFKEIMNINTDKSYEFYQNEFYNMYNEFSSELHNIINGPTSYSDDNDDDNGNDNNGDDNDNNETDNDDANDDTDVDAYYSD